MRRSGHKDGGSGPSRMVCGLLVLLALFLCLQQVCYFWGSYEKKAIMIEAVDKYRNGTEPQALLYPVWWYAPFFTGSGERRRHRPAPFGRPRLRAGAACAAGAAPDAAPDPAPGAAGAGSDAAAAC
jgi:hypothetical protein